MSAVAQLRNTPHPATLRRGFDLLRAAWTWLERKRATQVSARRMRLSETISLGEKRTVSILQVDGRHYLIGASSANVQLLAVLDAVERATQPDIQQRES